VVEVKALWLLEEGAVKSTAPSAPSASSNCRSGRAF
jgi:hypothetical protein